MSSEDDDLSDSPGPVTSAVRKVYFGWDWHLYDLSHATRWDLPETFRVRDVWPGGGFNVHRDIAHIFHSLHFDCMYRAGDGTFILEGAFLETLPRRRDPIPIGGGMYALEDDCRERWSVLYLGISEKDACSVFVTVGLQHLMPPDLLRRVQGVPPVMTPEAEGAVIAHMAVGGQVPSISLGDLVASETPGPVIVIRPPGEESTIDGVSVGKLTSRQFTILKALAGAHPKHLSGKKLHSVTKKDHPDMNDPDAVLRYLLKRNERWKKVVATGDGYGLVANARVTVVES